MNRISTIAVAIVLALPAVAQQETQPSTAPETTQQEAQPGAAQETTQQETTQQETTQPETMEQEAAPQEAAPQETTAGTPGSTQVESVVTADMLQDARVLALEGNYNQQIWEESAPLSTMVADLNEVGEVEDIVIGSQGQILGITIDVGGFIGIGQRTVLIPLEDIRLVQPADGGDITIVTRLDQEALENLQEFNIGD